MTPTKLIAAAVVLSSLIATPVLAQDYYGRRGMDRHYSDRGFGPGDLAAGIVGGAVGTAAAIAGSPYGSYAYQDGYGNGYGSRIYDPDYAARNGFVCQPGTWFRGQDGRPHPCQ
jgi:hypothetical protein